MRPEELADVITNAVHTIVAPLVTEIGALRERLTAVEACAAVPGPPGPPGRDGLDGAKGADGLGIADVSVALEGDRTLAITFKNADHVATFPIVLPFPRYCGTFENGRAYAVGDVITHGGSAFHCQAPTLRPPREGSDDWRLMVKRGHDGRDSAPARARA